MLLAPEFFLAPPQQISVSAHELGYISSIPSVFSDNFFL